MRDTAVKGDRPAACAFVALTCLAALSLLTAARASAGNAERVNPTPVHIVASGETLWSIAARHNTSVEALAAVNRLPSIHRLQVGDRLALTTSQLPGDTGRISRSDRHVVRSGETLWAIAGLHGTAPRTLARINNLPDEATIAVGQVLQLPGRAQAVRRTPPPTVAAPRSAVLPAIRPGFGWPSRGILTSRFGFRGRRHHHGIDIAAPVGTPITAAQDGTVTFAGWLRGYGRLVIVDHGRGLTTWYGHASRIVARTGQRVRRGDLIARVGTTGHVTGPNLHFEVRRNNAPLDPLAFLRKGTR